MCLCSCTPCEGIHAQVTSQGGGTGGEGSKPSARVGSAGIGLGRLRARGVERRAAARAKGPCAFGGENLLNRIQRSRGWALRRTKPRSKHGTCASLGLAQCLGCCSIVWILRAFMIAVPDNSELAVMTTDFQGSRYTKTPNSLGQKVRLQMRSHQRMRKGGK